MERACHCLDKVINDQEDNSCSEQLGNRNSRNTSSCPPVSEKKVEKESSPGVLSEGMTPEDGNKDFYSKVQTKFGKQDEKQRLSIIQKVKDGWIKSK